MKQKAEGQSCSKLLFKTKPKQTKKSQTKNYLDFQLQYIQSSQKFQN